MINMAGKDDKGKAGAKKPAPGAGKKTVKGRKASSSYEISGNSLKRKNKFCPKCGTGFFLALHKDRSTCGKCGYTERK